MDTTTINALFATGGALSGAGLTVMGSYLTTRANAKTVDRQLALAREQNEAERQHRLALTGITNEHAMRLEAYRTSEERNTQWNERRTEVHATLLTTMNNRLAELRMISSDLGIYYVFAPDVERAVALIDELQRVKTPSPDDNLSIVLFYSGRKTRELARTACMKLAYALDVISRRRMYSVPSDLAGFRNQVDTFNRAVTDAAASVADYESAVRVELRVTD